MKKRIVIGIAAHADAGKTTLAEAMLVMSGVLRTAGRVDSGSAYLDTTDMEKQRGITVFSHQAVMTYKDIGITILDTPGHSDFSAEAERTFSVLDAAVLVISGTDGVQPHTMTLWRLLGHYGVPVIVFVNKTDISHRLETIPDELKRLSDRIVPYEEEYLAECDERIMDEYLENGSVSEDTLVSAFAERAFFPCFFGSALRNEGVGAVLEAAALLTSPRHGGDGFGARVYKISGDNGTRLTHMKITGGTLSVRDRIGDEKVTRLRIYSGSRYTQTDTAEAGEIVAAEGITSLAAGDGAGFEKRSQAVLEPVMRYKVISDADPLVLYDRLREIEAEEPVLRVRRENGEISVFVMGDIQLEVLRNMYAERFGGSISFGGGSISYRETIAAPVTGIGHYEPLRHYAEVVVEISPLPAGSGIICGTDCSEDILHRRFQHMVISCLESKEHIGVLTGSPLTDVKITLKNGRDHVKHTEGGDFRQAALRAVRMGLMHAENVLLEPYLSFVLTVPQSNVGRAMTDMQNMGAEFGAPDQDGDMAVIKGSAPAAGIGYYHSEIQSYTGGRGLLSTEFDGYYPCRNADEVIAEVGYDPEADLENPPDSVFCSHGVGTVVRWDMVRDYMHTEEDGRVTVVQPEITPAQAARFRARLYSDDELMEIFERTYGRIERPKRYAMRREENVTSKPHKKPVQAQGKDYLIVDGYNIIFAWDDLRELSKTSLDHARHRLTEMMINYAGFKNCELILVFDAYRTHEERRTERVSNITVVYTKEAETADMYIERTTHELAPKAKRVRVATSDYAEQLIILGNGALRISAREFYEEMRLTEDTIRTIIEGMKRS
ncbi:MAG: TetM/TetW/TetO/TetS family tetracycline resistance ribosomal protection protein [Oscillospiraceae bacterium]|nr:TetM/TetW/TetO/TetS family tetracycline resistance ribosomal protection protein [Oscillospiraceae bacterium]